MGGVGEGVGRECREDRKPEVTTKWGDACHAYE